jgi:beta-lactamase class A
MLRLPRLSAAVLMMVGMLCACAPATPPQATQLAVAVKPTSVPTPTVARSAPLADAAAVAPAPPPTLVPTVAATLTPRPQQPLQPVVDSIVAQHPGTIGVLVKDLTTGDTARLNADRRFRSASLYKLFVMQTAADQLEKGSLRLDEVLTLTPELVADDPYSDLPAGTRTSVDCALQSMLQMSANSAADLLVDRLGMQAINAHMVALGLRQSVITDETAFTSPSDVARLLEILAGSAAASPISARLLDMLAAQQHADRLPVPLPLGVRVAHKTGELVNLRHDAGIVYAPGGPYVFVALVQEAPSEAAARETIVDLSRAVYTALEPSGPTLYRGLLPRVARDVFGVPDAQGRLPLLGDARTETTPLLPSGQGELRIRTEALPDLLALQADAAQQSYTFSVLDALRAPTDAQATQARPTVYVAPCAMELPGPGEGQRYGQPLAAEREPGLQQQWLGTVVVIGDAQGHPFGTPERDSPVGQWLRANAWQHGFIPAPAETDAGKDLGHEPWTLRWVGGELAAELHARNASGAETLAELRRLQAQLASQSAEAPVSAAESPCWTAPDTTTQGCPSRWFFSP